MAFRIPRLLLLVGIIGLIAAPGSGAAPTAPVGAAPAKPLGTLPMPADLGDAINGGAPPAQVPFDDLLRAATEGQLRVAIVDPASRWVAATDSHGHVVAAQAPPVRYGLGWGPVPFAANTGPASVSLFTLTDALHGAGTTIVTYQPDAKVIPKARGGFPFFLLLFPIGIAAIVLTMATASRRRQRRAQGDTAPFTVTGAGGKAKKGQAEVIAAPTTRFADVAGCDEVVAELEEIVLFLQEPERFSAVGADMPRGVILHGPPGTGKTLLARAVAGEAGVPFYSAAGSEFVEKYVGVGAGRVRDLFKKALAHPEGAVVFIDEIDAVGRSRGAAGGGNEERENTLNQLLVAMDGFDRSARVVVLAATNRLDMLDEALLRPGRFDRHVRVDPPNERGRLAILNLHAARKPVESITALKRLAKVTAGSSGATLALMLNEAAIMAARDGRSSITGADLAEGQLRALAGPQKADAPFTPEERVRIAWHEAGHALAAELCPTHACTQRVTILARGQAGGLALYGREDRALMSPQDLHERCVVALAGRAAEELHFGGVSSGAANDLEMVNAMIRQAVTELGFSPTVGQLVAPARAGGVQLLSDATREQIDHEVRRMIDRVYRDAIALLTAHKRELGTFAEALLEHEQLEREDIEAIVGSFTPRRRPARAVARLAQPHRAAAAKAAEQPGKAKRTEGVGARIGRRARRATEPWLTPGNAPQIAASSDD